MKKERYFVRDDHPESYYIILSNGDKWLNWFSEKPSDRTFKSNITLDQILGSGYREIQEQELVLLLEC